MKKYRLIFLALFLLPLFSRAQEVDILIFSADGDVKIKRNDMSIPCERGDKIVPGDIIHVKKGVITLVTRNLKRVSLEKKGKYSYKEIVKSFSLINGSFENKFLLQLLDKMMNKSNPGYYANAVLNGTRNMQPLDSALILSDSIRFIFPNPENQKLTFFLLDQEHNTIFTKETTDSLLVLKQGEAAWWKPGTYSWEAVTPGKKGSLETKLIIPNNEDRDELLMMYIRLRNSFPSYPLKARNQIIDEILLMNKWVMYLPQ